MKILIFEGIATSGKSTVISDLANKLSTKLNVSVAEEDKTHIPIMKESEELHIKFFDKLINLLVSENPDVLLIDRLYITQAVRANTDISQYEVIENKLLDYDTTTIFLKLQEDTIETRVQIASKHRDSHWGEYIKTKGKSISEIAQYYISQQQSIKKLIDKSKIPHKEFDTTLHSYVQIVDELMNLLPCQKTPGF